MKRLFTFGCSFTQYWRWPTWADALGRNYDFFENWGYCGGGNSLVFNSLMECHQRRKLTADDDVYIMWSNTSREDRYVGNRWFAKGNIYWTDGSELPLEYVLKFTCERGFLIRDLATITATKNLLEHWGCNWKFMSIVPLGNTNQNSELGFNPNDQISDNMDVKSLYSSTLSSIAPSVYETVFGQNWNSRPGIKNTDGRRDFHPTPLEHLEYLDNVYPGLINNKSTRDWMAECDQLASEKKLEWREPNKPNVRL